MKPFVSVCLMVGTVCAVSAFMNRDPIIMAVAVGVAVGMYYLLVGLASARS